MFNFLTDFTLEGQEEIALKINTFIMSERFTTGEINYIFCDDVYLYQLNKEFLNKTSYTDIISFDYCSGKQISGDIFISVERVLENAKFFQVSFKNELQRVMIHGILHYMGYTDSTIEDKKKMRNKEDTTLLQLKLDL